jgi:hypothetical protein
VRGCDAVAQNEMAGAARTFPLGRVVAKPLTWRCPADDAGSGTNSRTLTIRLHVRAADTRIHRPGGRPLYGSNRKGTLFVLDSTPRRKPPPVGTPHLLPPIATLGHPAQLPLIHPLLGCRPHRRQLQDTLLDHRRQMPQTHDLRDPRGACSNGSALAGKEARHMAVLPELAVSLYVFD